MAATLHEYYRCPNVVTFTLIVCRIKQDFKNILSSICWNKCEQTVFLLQSLDFFASLKRKCHIGPPGRLFSAAPC